MIAELEHKFIQLTTDEFLYLLESGLSKKGILLFLRLKFNDPFGDRYRTLPDYDQLAEELEMSESTVRRQFNKIVELGLIIVDYCNRFVSACKNLKVATDRVRAKIFCPEQNCQENVNSENSDSVLTEDFQSCQNQQLELPLDNDLGTSQTLQTDQTLQTGEEEVEEEINREQEKEISQTSDSTKSFTCLPNHKPKTNPPPSELQKKYQIPEELAERLRMAKIALCDQVLVKISQHHISQAYGAVTHVENTWTTIKDPKAVFLYQLPRQPIEQLGPRYSDELLEKQKREQERIGKEIARGRPPITAMPKYQALKEKLAKKVGSPQETERR